MINITLMLYPVNDWGTPEQSWLALDDESACYDLLEYLHELGHRRIMYLDEPGIHWHSSKDLRSTTYCRFMRERGLESFSHVLSWSMTEQALGVVKGYGATALVCYSASVADLILKEAVNAGIKVPQELSIVTFNTLSKEDSFSARELTAAHYPLKEIGLEAAGIILQSMVERREPVNKIFKAEMHIGDTAGPVNLPKAGVCIK